jgi:hypothetical protein
MSPETESRASTSAGRDVAFDPQGPSKAPVRALASGKASRELPQERERAGLSSLWCAGSLLAIVGMTAFVASGLWQVGAIIRGAREVARDVAVGHGAAGANANPGEPTAAAVVAAPVAPDPVPAAPAAVPTSARQPAAARDPVLTTAASPATSEQSARSFEAQAEASEQIIPVGLKAALDATDGGLSLGRPPPADYPRVDCNDIFVYIVTIAEGAPERSAASIGVGKRGPARFRRLGETIGDWTVLAITDDWTGLNPDVWLEKDGTACRAELEGNASRVHQAPKPPPRPKAKARRRPRRR